MIYFDSAATTFQKPPAVEAAMVGALRTMSSPGRGGYPAAMAAAAKLGMVTVDGDYTGRAIPEIVQITYNYTGAGGLYHERHTCAESRHKNTCTARRTGGDLRL